jgi:hypothetical protein
MITENWIVHRLFDYEDDFKWKTLNYKLVDHVKTTIFI